MSDLPDTDLFSERDRAQEVCSILLSNGYAPVAEFRDLLLDENLRWQVEKRLNAVGMKLMHNVYSENWGIGLNEQTAADERLEWSNNFGLDRGAIALLLILWCKLILPKRLEQESSQKAEGGDEEEEEPGTLSETFTELEDKPTPRASISRDQIIAEFSPLLGGVTNASKYLAQLSRARLIKSYGGIVEEGPLLSLVIDEASLNDDLRKEVLLSVLRHGSKTQTLTQSIKPEAENQEQGAETADV